MPLTLKEKSLIVSDGEIEEEDLPPLADSVYNSKGSVKIAEGRIEDNYKQDKFIYDAF
jgi:hypothetical protein